MSLRSMTAFGAGEYLSATHQYQCEIKTLNSRFLDHHIRMPRKLSSLEPQIIKLVKSKLSRGKVDIFIDIQKVQSDNSSLPQLNKDALEHYLTMLEPLKELSGIESKLSLSQILRLEGVLLSQSEQNTDQAELHHEGILKSLERALEQVIISRSEEGSALAPSLTELIAKLSNSRSIVTKNAEVINESIFDNYHKKILSFLDKAGEAGQQILAQTSKERLLTEVAILADKADIKEELVRLEAHETEFLATMKKDISIGRKLDFLCQEMHREVNTISSKISQLEIGKQTLEMKQTVEQLRQQVQNVE